MIKTAEQEVQLKLAIRNEIARDPLITVGRLQQALKKRGFETANGNPLDWRYVSKLVRKLTRERALAVDQQKINERLAITKENYRLIVEKLWKIIFYKYEYIETDGIYPPKTDEVLKAANTIMKLDLAILKAEMNAGIFDRKLGTVDVNMYRAVPIDPEKAEAIVAGFKAWGIDLHLPQQRPKLSPANGNPDTPDSGQGIPAAS